ncbi:MAG: cytidylyltransferase [Elusimicrobiota bacterium]
MICALMLGRDGSRGFPGKNTTPVLGRPLMAYPLLAAKASKHVERAYVSTDSPGIKKIALEFGARVIDRPAELCTPQALGEDAFAHGYRVIRDELKKEGHELEFLLLLFCNAATVSAELINEGVNALRERPEADSVVSVSRYNMWSPLRARKENKKGFLDPFVPFETFGDPKTLNCDRDSQGDVWYADMGLSIVRPRCFDAMQDGLLPQRWMGKNIHPLKQWGGCDVDYEWQMPGVEYWLLKHGVKPAEKI